jgi:hypothetical protein
MPPNIQGLSTGAAFDLKMRPPTATWHQLAQVVEAAGRLNEAKAWYTKSSKPGASKQEKALLAVTWRICLHNSPGVSPMGPHNEQSVDPSARPHATGML